MGKRSALSAAGRLHSAPPSGTAAAHRPSCSRRSRGRELRACGLIYSERVQSILGEHNRYSSSFQLRSALCQPDQMKPGKLPQRFRSGRGCEKQQLKFAAAEAADPWRLRLERVRGKVDLYEEGRIPGANQRILPPAAYASLSLSPFTTISVVV